MRSKITNTEGRIQPRTEYAILFSANGERDNGVWLPLSQCGVEMKEGA
ncbi:hypothetical protein [Paracoccus rhizosphaerae]|uniref:Uncharacterized protein n=1 Tax=Paracoccus rhizosphaerae TaxID=1133347 RepID=A0ABV6CNY3_9RHOB|nr:hypothetical protein [Paracoccus rhizosphaerae]